MLQMTATIAMLNIILVDGSRRGGMELRRVGDELMPPHLSYLRAGVEEVSSSKYSRIVEKQGGGLQ